MSEQNKISIKFWLDAILHSYSQIFFSLNKIFAAILLIVTFFDIKTGVTGFLAVIFINLLAIIFGLSKQATQQGLYGFNALLLGLGLGYTYQSNGGFWILFSISILFLLIITAWIEGLFKNMHLPFLIFPFLIVYWTISVAAQNFGQIHLNYIDPSKNAPVSFYYQITHVLDQVNFPTIALVYFKTLNGIFFQDTILGGLLISIGLLIHSRISFSLTFLGFVSAYISFKFLGADIAFLNYHLLGSNFILMAIAIGCFYIVPNIYSYLIVVILTPVLMILLFSLQKILLIFQLSGYTVSFSILVTMFLYFLHQRWLSKYLHLVTIQYYSPEKTIYKYLSAIQKSENTNQLKILLPFWGNWKVSQGYNGSITHLDEWSKALDFVIVDEEGKTYKNNGINKNDFYCYNKPVLAPGDGYVQSIINTVEDNDITDVDTNKNWGNTIIINHSNELYSQISHLKKDSFKVNVGDYVAKGTTLATCGNSGRSPEPHIHFQLQTSSKIGEKTLAYPIAYFIKHTGNKNELKVSEVPGENDIISNIETTALLSNTFNFIPGKKIRFKDENNSISNWEILTDAWNRTYFYCDKTLSYAYFMNDEIMFYFYDFEGDKNSLLFQFYLAFHRILLGYYQDIKLDDQLPLSHFNNKIVNFIQDFFAPFYCFSKAIYQSSCTFIDDVHSPQRIELNSKVTTSIFNSTLKETRYDIIIVNNRIEQFTIFKNTIKQTFIWEE